jgi:hypothetical protein
VLSDSAATLEQTTWDRQVGPRINESVLGKCDVPTASMSILGRLCSCKVNAEMMRVGFEFKSCCLQTEN